MRWLMIALLVSVVGLLAAALGMARHIWVQRSLERRERAAKARQESEEAEPEIER
jgi:Tfp pilus assembly protein PilV